VPIPAFEKKGSVKREWTSITNKTIHKMTNSGDLQLRRNFQQKMSSDAPLIVTEIVLEKFLF
jgi:hypothetical protein